MNIRERLGRIKFFDVTPDLSSLSFGERGALEHCVAAARVVVERLADLPSTVLPVYHLPF